VRRTPPNSRALRAIGSADPSTTDSKQDFQSVSLFLRRNSLGSLAQADALSMRAAVLNATTRHRFAVTRWRSKVDSNCRFRSMRAIAATPGQTVFSDQR
jgi:hypothetical protein